MLKRMMAYGTAAFLLIGAACLTDGDAVLYVVVTSPVPDTTSSMQVGITGEVFRTPQKESAILVVTVTGGAITAIDTASLHGLFTVTVPLLTNATNDLELTGHDDTGATTAGPWRHTVVHVDEGQ